MLTRDERRALLFLAGTAVLGGAVRAARAGGDGPPGAALVAPELTAGDVAAQEAGARRALALTRPLAPGELVDVDHADEAELDRLPRVGPALARRIVAERTAHGPFGSLVGLGRVQGMGAGTLKGLEGRASFSGAPATSQAASQGAQGVQEVQGERRSRGGRGRQGGVPPPALPAPAPAIATMPPLPAPARLGVTVVAPRRTRSRRAITVLSVCPGFPLAINDADARELDCLPGIGPAMAERIVAWRTAHGRFAEVKDLERVPGIGPAHLARLLPYVRAP
jgi:competence protein ComEA